MASYSITLNGTNNERLEVRVTLSSDGTSASIETLCDGHEDTWVEIGADDVSDLTRFLNTFTTKDLGDA